jgi:hypothetical protein
MSIKLRACARLAVVVLGLPASLAASDRDRVERLQWRGHAQSASVVVLPGHTLHPERCGSRPAALIAGAGLTTVLGQFTVRQSHCLNEAGSFDDGQFEFMKADGTTVTGQYSGQLIPSLPPPPNTPPAGVINGQVCVEGGTALTGIVDDCAAGRYSPALGVLNLATGDGTIFIDYKLGVRR